MMGRSIDIDILHLYKAELVRVVDADTVRFRLDLGFCMTFEDNFRLHDINAPELKTLAGKEAKAWLIGFFAKHADKQLHVVSSKHGKYRWLARAYFYAKDEVKLAICINDAVVEAGHATRREGK